MTVCLRKSSATNSIGLNLEPDKARDETLGTVATLRQNKADEGNNEGNYDLRRLQRWRRLLQRWQLLKYL